MTEKTAWIIFVMILSIALTAVLIEDYIKLEQMRIKYTCTEIDK
jgi:hypothetical protein